MRLGEYNRKYHPRLSISLFHHPVLFHLFLLPIVFILVSRSSRPELCRSRNDPYRYLQALLTAFQCLALSTGLLKRWRVYYPPLATLIRLIALQGICWPATKW
jgi:hypothetical protein